MVGFTGKIIGRDEQTDIAVIKVAKDPAVTFADTSAIVVPPWLCQKKCLVSGQVVPEPAAVRRGVALDPC
jgi:S1-C subfamily serine protease